ncbi:hypothetical protein CPB84DRAFT_1823893 [Gymnopilus junonius]|uniref:DUF6534 domain-containing protein n=1 Tax=Gymnopilus junonius TaxID=109634 RepID=A0A9P5NT16_GYMJU|nr:hypothetical protein CPB84DRAFT_1823893 [Gymnopilus junonius]
MAAPPLPVVPSLDNSYGSIYIGMVVAAGLWGIGTAQVYWYFTAYEKDPLALKLVVSSAWVFDTVHQALISYLIYFYVITNYFNPTRLDLQIWVFSVQSLFEILPCFIVQTFFLVRIWRLSNGKFVLVILPASFYLPQILRFVVDSLRYIQGLLIVTKMVLGIGWRYHVWIGLCFRTKSISDAEARFGHISEIVNGIAAAADILLGATMVCLLYLARTGIRQSDNMLAKLMLYTINTGAITSVWSIVTLITAVQLSKTYIYGAFYWCIGRLYVNTMLASLNARKNLKEKNSVVEMTAIGFESNQSRSGLGSRALENPGGKYEDERFKSSQTLGMFVSTQDEITDP